MFISKTQCSDLGNYDQWYHFAEIDGCYSMSFSDCWLHLHICKYKFIPQNAVASRIQSKFRPRTYQMFHCNISQWNNIISCVAVLRRSRLY